MIDNKRIVIVLPAFNASQALQLRAPLRSSEFIESFLTIYRKEVSFVSEDRVLHDDIENSLEFINALQINNR
jgi:histidine ammonia-lyase